MKNLVHFVFCSWRVKRLKEQANKYSASESVVRFLCETAYMIFLPVPSLWSWVVECLNMSTQCWFNPLISTSVDDTVFFEVS